LGDAGTVAWYVEAKYKFAPQFFGALRWNQQFFGTTDQPGARASLGADLSRLDAAATYRFTEHIQFKVQYSYQHATDSGEEDNHLVAAQCTVRF
jgi:predicted porin